MILFALSLDESVSFTTIFYCSSAYKMGNEATSNVLAKIKKIGQQLLSQPMCPHGSKPLVV